MKAVPPAVLSTLLLFAGAPAFADAGWNGDVGLVVGSTANEHFPTARALYMGGAGATLGLAGIYLEGRYLFADTGGCPYEGCTREEYHNTLNSVEGGLLYSPRISLGRHVDVMPLLGGGGTQLHLHAERVSGKAVGDAESGDSSYGYYGKAGVAALFIKKIDVSLEFERVRGTHVFMFGQQATANHDAVSCTVAWHWGEHMAPAPPRRPRGRH